MKYKNDVIYINDIEFPYTPVHNVDLNDVDLDPYTNTEGYTMRNRVRSDVTSLVFSIDTIKGKEMYDLLQLRKPEWFLCTFWSDDLWQIVTKKMYCSPFKYKRYYIDPTDPNENIYQDISFAFVEQ